MESFEQANSLAVSSTQSTLSRSVIVVGGLSSRLTLATRLDSMALQSIVSSPQLMRYAAGLANSPTTNRIELKYIQLSVVLARQRRSPFLTAERLDGGTTVESRGPTPRLRTARLLKPLILVMSGTPTATWIGAIRFGS